MKHILYGIVLIPVAVIFLTNIKTTKLEKEISESENNNMNTITGIVKPQDTMEAIFDKHNLNRGELFDIFSTAKNTYDLSMLSVGSVYLFRIDEQNRIQNMQYGIDDESFLEIIRQPEGFVSEKVNIRYTRIPGSLYITIEDNLVLSMPTTHREYLKLALELSEIYAWDIDFSSDIRRGDSVKIIVEELWAGEVFKGYGNILAVEFSNKGLVRKAYRFEHDGYADYYDSNGKSLRKTLLRSPIKYKYVSSRFSTRRFHPILRIYRPHLGVDYAASSGTPVSAAGDGKVVFAGYKGQNGKMVKVKHGGGLETYYCHLSRIPRRIKRGSLVSQGDIIGYVGSTGLSTGPHLDYRIRLKGRFVNPLNLRLPNAKSVQGASMARYRKEVEYLDTRLALLKEPIIAYTEKRKKVG